MPALSAQCGCSNVDLQQSSRAIVGTHLMRNSYDVVIARCRCILNAGSNHARTLQSANAERFMCHQHAEKTLSLHRRGCDCPVSRQVAWIRNSVSTGDDAIAQLGSYLRYPGTPCNLTSPHCRRLIGHRLNSAFYSACFSPMSSLDLELPHSNAVTWRYSLNTLQEAQQRRQSPRHEICNFWILWARNGAPALAIFEKMPQGLNFLRVLSFTSIICWPTSLCR